MKKILSVFLCFVIVFSLSACNKDDEYDGEAEDEYYSEDYKDEDYDEDEDEDEDYYEYSGTYVYVTDYGTKYHRSYCSYLKSSKNRIDLNKALNDGYSPCSRCNPPKR